MPLSQRSIGVLLDLVFGNADVPGGGRHGSLSRRVLVLPVLRHHGNRKVRRCTARPRSPRRTRIVCQPYEWRHDVKDVGLNVDEQARVEVAVRHHVNGPGASVTWDIQRQKPQIVPAPQIDWRKAT